MRCETFHITMSVAGCLAVQKARVAGAHHRTTTLNYPGCRTCEKGRLAREGRLCDSDVDALKNQYRTGKGDEEVMRERPLENENEQRTTSSEHDGGSADGVGAPTRVCPGCPEKGPQPIENFYKNRSGHEGVCKKCKRAKSREHRTRLRAGSGVEERAGGDPSVRETDASPLVITIDLTGYPDIYEAIKCLAEEEDRTVEGQVRYWLRRHPLAKPDAF